MDLIAPLLIVRLVIGLGFAAHGAQKLFGWFGGYGLAGTGGFLESLGFRPGRLFAAAAGTAELAGGVLLALGLGGPIGPALIISAMTVAILTVHVRNGFFAASNGFELPLLYVLVGVLYAFAGFGPASLDAVFGWTTVWTPLVTWALVVLGFIGGALNLTLRRTPGAAPAPAASETLDPAV